MRYMHIHIIPQHTGKKKYIRVPLEIIIITLILLIFLFVSSIVYIKININKIASRRKVSVLKKETQILKDFKEEMSYKLDSLRENLSELENKTNQIEPMVEFAIGVPLKQVKAETMVDIDSLYVLSKQLAYDTDLIRRKESQITENSQFIPSIMPVKGWISVPFGKIKDPITEKIVNHFGVTITAPKDSDVKATGAGNVSMVGKDKEMGNYVIIDHTNYLSTVYAHLDTVFVKNRDMIKRGEIIGKVGKTGRSVFYSLYYEVRLKGKPVNPEMYIIK